MHPRLEQGSHRRSSVSHFNTHPQKSIILPDKIWLDLNDLTYEAKRAHRFDIALNSTWRTQMEKISAAREAVQNATVEGPVRKRALDALAQVDGTGRSFKLFIEGSKRQIDCTLKALKEAGVIKVVTRSRPGFKAIYRVTEGFMNDFTLAQEPTEESDETVDGLFPRLVDDAWVKVQMPPVKPTQWKYVASVWVPRFSVEEGREPSLTSEDIFRSLRRIATSKSIEADGKIGNAIDTVLWTIAVFPAGVSFSDFSLEGDSGPFSERTLKSALAQLKTAGIIEVHGTGRQPRVYMLADQQR